MDLNWIFDILTSPWLSLLFLPLIGYFCWHNVYDYNDLPDCVTAIGANEGTIFITEPTDVTNDLTIPANITLRIIQGGTLNISVGKTVTINGHIEAGLYQIFEGAGSVSFGSGETIGIIHPDWFAGANMGAKLIAAIATASNGSVIYVPPTTTFYPLDGIVTIAKRITILGNLDYNYLTGSMFHKTGDFDGFSITSVGVRILGIGVEGIGGDTHYGFVAQQKCELHVASNHNGKSGVYLQQVAGSNLNETIIRCYVEDNGENGILLNNSTANPPDINSCDIHAIVCQNNVARGYLATHTGGGGLPQWNRIKGTFASNGVYNLQLGYGDIFEGFSEGAATAGVMCIGQNIVKGVIADDVHETAGTKNTIFNTHPNFPQNVLPQIVLSIPSELTIAAGVITVTKSYHILTPQGGAVDDLDTINGGYDGMLLVLKGDGTFQIDVKHNVGNILLSGGVDYLLPTTTQRILLQYDLALAKWIGFPGY